MLRLGGIAAVLFVGAVAAAAGCSGSSGCELDANGCTCTPGPSTIDCGRNQIPTDPSVFRKDLFFVTPCCASQGWPDEGSCTCEDRVGVGCFYNADGSCQCGAPGDNLGSDGTVAPSPMGSSTSCSAPSGGVCCAIPGPDPSGPSLACICGMATDCSAVAVGNGASAGAVQVDHCDGSNVFTTTCPDGTSQTPSCGSASSSSGSGSSSGSPKPECSSDSECSGKCSNDCYQCLYGSCTCGSEDDYGVCTF